MRRVLAFLLALSPLCAAQAEPERWIYRYAGSQVGTGTYEEFADGTFTAKAAIDLGVTKQVVDIRGRRTNGKLVSLLLDGDYGTRKVKLDWKEGKLSVTANGAASAITGPMPITTEAMLANLNPPIAATILRALGSKPSAEMDVLFLDSFRQMKVKVSQRPGTYASPTFPVPVTFATVGIQGLDIEFAFDAKGKTLAMNVPAQQFLAHREGFDNVFVDPLSRYPELSQRTHGATTEIKVMAVMRDGVKLAADIVRPNAAGRYPAILIRTPYGRGADAMKGEFWASRGYVLVAQDVRGRGDSEGAFDPFNHEIEDGKDTLDWLAAQPWCDGNVGMIGGSYLGLVQWAAAASGHPALKCIVPQVSPPDPTRNIPWDHGAFMLAPAVWWSRIVKDRQSDMSIAMTPIRKTEGFFKLPISKVDDAMLGSTVPFFDQWPKRPTIGNWKGAYTLEQVANTTLPALHISGVWDGDGVGTKLHWTARRNAGHHNQNLIFGPWEHGFNLKTRHADVEYGSASILELESIYLRFFDTHLKGRPVFWDRQPKVRFFVTGLNQWYSATDWPFPFAKPRTMFLAGGSAKGRKTQGKLSSTPAGVEFDRFVYDPNKVKFMPQDLDLEAASATTKLKDEDMDANDLYYSSDPFSTDIVIAGPIRLELAVSTTAKDATFHAFLTDEAPNGETRVIGMPGTKRVWFDVAGRPVPIVPNKVYRIAVEPWELAHRFKKAHRLGLLITSDLFPQFARNPGTGESEATATKLIRATHTIHRSAKEPSRLRFYSFEP